MSNVDNLNIQLFRGGGDNVPCPSPVRIPLDVRYIPGTTLGQEPRDFERCFEVDDEQPAPAGGFIVRKGDDPNEYRPLTLQGRYHDLLG